LWSGLSQLDNSFGTGDAFQKQLAVSDIHCKLACGQLRRIWHSAWYGRAFDKKRIDHD
jgi:hypothetical protein